MTGHLGNHISYLSDTGYTCFYLHGDLAGLTSRSEGVGDGDDGGDDGGAP